MIQINAPQAVETNNTNKCRNAYLYAASLPSRKLSRPSRPNKKRFNRSFCDRRVPARFDFEGRRMATIRQLLDKKGHEVFSVRPDETVYDSIKNMADKNVGSLAVMDGDKLVGVITERHYARNVVLKGRASPKTPVRDIMETNVIFARPDQSVEDCMAIMTEKAVRHLPVIEQGKVVGMISIGDLVKETISDQTFVIDQLVHFIHGTR
jgi:CBS domain-containing protein